MPLNHVVLASGAVVVVSVAVATVVAVYESPEFRRYAEDVRRRISMVFDSVSDSFEPSYREPRFNRPEDADGFLQSYRRGGAEEEIDADDASRRKQREELLYWNSIRLEKQRERQQREHGEMDEKQGLPRPPSARRGSTFDDFLQPDASGEKGSLVFNSGADVNHHARLRHRGEAARGLYADDNDDDDNNNTRGHSAASDIYSATTVDRDVERPTPTVDASSSASAPAPLIDLAQQSPREAPAASDRRASQLADVAPALEDRHGAYASIQAWAHESSRGFYSPLPETPVAPVSEPELISEGDFSDAGQLTPTDTLSLAGSGEDVAHDVGESGHLGTTGRVYDVMSESEGMETPASWSEVGSVISDDFPPHV